GCLRQPSSGASDALPDVGGRDDRGLVMDLGRVPIEGGGGLSADVAIPGIEVDGADAVRAADAGELYAFLDPLGSVVSHALIVRRRWGGNGAQWSGGESNEGDPGLTTRFNVARLSNRKWSIGDTRPISQLCAISSLVQTVFLPAKRAGLPPLQ